MGQRVSSCSHPSYGDYEKLKSEEDSIVQKKNKSQKEDSYQQLHFQFELGKKITQSILLNNNSDDYMAFRVNTTNPKKYNIMPNIGDVKPRSSCDIKVIMQAQEEAPPNLQCKDLFVIQTIFVKPGATTKDITPKMFEKNSGYKVIELTLQVVYVAPPKLPSLVQEISDKESFPRASLTSDKNTSTIVEAENSMNEHIKKLQQEVNYLRSEMNKFQRKNQQTKIDDEDCIIM
ncbi:vesicle-associated protein 1-2 [Trifolium repens]|nr:vesicle-associated protein 1-2 [Trifolium repens]